MFTYLMYHLTTGDAYKLFMLVDLSFVLAAYFWFVNVVGRKLLGDD